ncbi:hypothetical protein [Amycolatopsis sp. 3B14]|uniref:hypothetical protein n=1 Tax=Amycolatopsis sp. 3B14 TaxID=3243600 RepID=UPI003D98D997
MADRRFAGRWHAPPIANIPRRYALVDCEFDGTGQPAGDALMLATADPLARWL